MTIEGVAERFRLGRLVLPPMPVPGGLSNDLFRVDTDLGRFAVKRMVINAERPGFVANVEASYLVERRAFDKGVGMPEPYRERADVEIPREPWIFEGWIEALGGWLAYNVARRADTPLGQSEIALTQARLQRLAASQDTLLDALPE